MADLRFYYYDKLLLSKPADYNFRLTAAVYNFSWWFDGEQLLIPIDYAILSVRNLSEELEVKIYTSSSIGSDAIDKIVKYVKHVLGFNEDLFEFYSIMSRDPLLSNSLEVLRGMHFRASTPWIASVIGVCQQNASFKQGWKMFYNFIKTFGMKTIVEDKKTYIPPQPKDIDEGKVDLLKSVGIGYRVLTILSLAKMFNKFRDLNTWDANPVELEERLLSIKGVGNYTARLCLALSLRVYDKPLIDRWLRRIASEVYGVPEKDVENLYTRVWGRWGGLATLYTTVALDAEPLNKALDRIRKGLLKPDLSKLSPLTMWRYL